jgi:drug/metabolite transporter (DMT)-like permease
MSRRFRETPSEAVTGFCAATALLAAICHVLFETTLWPDGATQWLAVIALGLGPVGIAFYVWDIGMKHGDIRALGAASYAAPVLSTACLVLAGYAPASWLIAVSAALIACGGLMASGAVRN